MAVRVAGFSHWTFNGAGHEWHLRLPSKAVFYLPITIVSVPARATASIGKRFLAPFTHHLSLIPSNIYTTRENHADTHFHTLVKDKMRKHNENTLRCLLTSVVVLTFSATVGCSWIAGKIADSLAASKVRSFKRQVTVSQGKGKEFLECMEKTGKNISTPIPLVVTDYLRGKPNTNLSFSETEAAELEPFLSTALVAAQVFEHPVHQEVANLFNKVASPKTSANDDIVLDQDGIDKYMELVEKATSQNGWESIAYVSNKLAIRARTDEAQSFANETKLIAAYMKAYFRAGKFTTITLNETKLKDALKSSLGIENPSAIYDLLFGGLFKPDAQKNGQVFGSIGKVAFVTRGGDSFQFPAIQTSLDVTAAKPIHMSKIDFTSVGSDLIRVLFEAILDAKFGVPGVTNSTGVETKVLKDFKDLNPKTVTQEQFGVIEQVSKGVEGGVTSAVGRLIRGAGLISLNNEALASIIETLVGITLKKASEKVCWCYFEAKNSKQSGTTAFTDTTPMTINIVVRGTAPLALSQQ